jgi:predicted alpha/beta-fold hydrolase
LSDFIKNQKAFKPAWWLKNSHLQTIYPSLFRKISSPSEMWRERLITPDNDFIDIDFCGKGNTPLVILLHGLAGSSKSGYIRGLQQILEKKGYRSVTLNFRGCSGESNNLARGYHSGETEDIHFLYQTLRQREPDTPIAAIGFSLGGNVLLKWIGEQGNKVSLFCTVAVSVPFVLSTCATKLDTGFSRLYRKNLIDELKQYIKDKYQHLINIGNTQEAKKLSQLGDLTNIKSFWQYDNQVVAKLHGFKNVEDYYLKSSSRQFLKSIAVPTLLLQASDDPFMTQSVIPELSELSVAVQLEMTQRGGHVGFVEGKNPFRAGYWLEERISHFLEEKLGNFPVSRER